MENTIWNAIVNCEKDFDGVFYYGVVTTGIFCRPSCKSKTPKRENVKIYTKIQQAKKDGLRPCKRCQPEMSGHVNSKDLAIAQAVGILEKRFAEPWTLDMLSAEVYTSPFWLQRIFKEKVGVSPFQYLSSIRIQEAQKLLISTDQSITDIALSIGFKNSSHFSSAFTKQMGDTPAKYRKSMRIKD